jgi:tetratricopeptide (TPR) repeat protein
MLFAVIPAELFTAEYQDTLSTWLIPLREALYEEEGSPDIIYPLYTAAKTTIQHKLQDAEQLIELSRAEYFMGRVYQLHKQNDKALHCYQIGYKNAEDSIAQQETSSGWEMLSAHLGQMCMIKSKAWVMAHGLDVERFAKNALKLNANNVTAQYMIASRWVYAPWPFNNTEKGITMMFDILNAGASKQKDDLFNLYVALAYGYLRDKKKQEARIWLDKALSIYPTNKFAGVELKTQCE